MKPLGCDEVRGIHDEVLAAGGDPLMAIYVRGLNDGSRMTQRQILGPDKCEECHGERGGVPGNENIVDGRILCDYCDARLRREVGG